MTKKQNSFESSLEELEKIVAALEDGDRPLEEALELFEKGVKLSRKCQKRLDEAERKIQVLLKDAEGEPVLEKFESEDPGNAAG